MASWQLRNSRGSKSATIHPLQSLSTPLPGAETGPCKCSLFWQTHSLHLHGTPYKTSWNEVRYFCLFFSNHKKSIILTWSFLPLVIYWRFLCNPSTTVTMFTSLLCLAEGTLNTITMVYVWNQIPRLIDFKKTCSTWPSDSSQFSRSRGPTSCHAAILATRFKVVGILRFALWLQVQASAEVWRWLWGQLHKWKPAPSWCSRADRYRTEPAPPAVPRSASFSTLSACLKRRELKQT